MNNLNNLPNSFYSKDPYGDIQTGDIFRDLPSMGLLKDDFVSGIIITPSCDLANRKTETITYLPIIPFETWFCSLGFYPKLITDLKAICNQFKLESYSLLGKTLIDQGSIEIIREECLEAKKLLKKKSDLDKIDKLVLGLEIINEILDPNSKRISSSKLKDFFMEKFPKIIQPLITNSSHSDLHFLPFENSKKDESYILTEHSLVLLRYPITIPYDILDQAKDLSPENIDSWKSFVSGKNFLYSSFEKIPLRGLQLRQNFLSDLLTRYVGLFVRIGSPDIDSLAIDEIIKEI